MSAHVDDEFILLVSSQKYLNMKCDMYENPIWGVSENTFATHESMSVFEFSVNSAVKM